VFDNKLKGEALPEVDYGSRAVTASLEAGYALRLFTDWLALEPQAQVLYTHYDQDNVTEPNGTRVTGADKDIVTSRFGARIFGSWPGAEGRKIEPYVEFNWWHDYQDESVALNDLVFDRGVPNDRFEAGVGFNAEVAKNWSLWVNGEYQFAAHGYEGIEALGGVKYTW
jgi:autotransporter family porin